MLTGTCSKCGETREVEVSAQPDHVIGEIVMIAVLVICTHCRTAIDHTWASTRKISYTPDAEQEGEDRE